MGRILAFTIILLLFVPDCLSAQTYLEPEIISREDGLSSDDVLDVAFDDQGFLWAATSRGLDRYDGYEVKSFLLPQSTFPAREAWEITRLSTDGSGNVWFLAAGVPGLYDVETGLIAYFHEALPDFEADYALVRPGADNACVDIAAGDDLTSWVLTDLGLVRLISDGQAMSYPFPENLAGSSIVPTCLAAQGSNVWIGCRQGTIHFNVESGSFLFLDLQTSVPSMSDSYVKSLCVEGNNAVWLGTGNGLIRFDPVDLDRRMYYPSGTRQAAPGNDITDISMMGNGKLLLVTRTGIMVFDTERNRFEEAGVNAEGAIQRAVSDAMGNIWCASSSGICKIKKTRLIVENYNSERIASGPATGHVQALQTLTGNDLWVGYEAGLDIIDTRTFDIRHISIPEGEKVRALYRFRTDQMAVLMRHTLTIYNPSGSRASGLTDLYAFTQPELLNAYDINCMLQDRSGNLWMGTSDGMHLLQPDLGRHIFYRALPGNGDSIKLQQVHVIRQDGNGQLWLGTDDGLIVFNTQQQTAEKYIPYDRNLLNTENKHVYTIVSHDSMVYWIGTSKGIFRFDIRGREFRALNDQVLMNASVFTITKDRYGDLWIGTDQGLFFHSPASGSVLYFDQTDGLASYAYTSSVLDGQGDVYVGGDHGLSRVDIAQEGQVPAGHRVVITGLYWLEQGGKQEILHTVPDTVVLPLKRNALQIDFAVLDLSKPENNNFQYTFARAGRDAGPFLDAPHRQIILNPLSQGRYVLKVRGSNSNQVWAREDTTLVIIIQPPFWRSRMVIVLLVFLLISLLVFGFLRLSHWFSRMSQQGREKEMIAKQIMEQKEELSLKNKSITDSINYAKRIQTAMLPPVKMLKADFPSSFILYMPKDIVSGDFYWINKMDEKIFVAAVDCTGHGVPGAFMSIIGFELFRKITSNEGLKRPSDILNRLNEDFHEIFKDVDVVLRDGMDVAFCSIDKSNKILEFSGAFNPLYLIRDNKITEIKGDRFAIGLDELDFMEQTFKNHLIPLQEGDIIYIFSDGFADQFGGPDGKKYKYRRFKHLLLNLHQLEMEKQREILENNVVEWRGEQEQVDDILIIGIKIDF